MRQDLPADGEGGRPPEGLCDWLASPQGRHKADRVRVAELPGGPLVVKRRVAGAVRTRLGRFLRAMRVLLVALLCGLAMGEYPEPAELLGVGLEQEADRLRRLRAQGQRVPAVLWQQPGMLVLEYVGEDVPHRLRRVAPADRIALMRHVGADLAQFHRAGFSHGGAQLRNLTVRQDGLWRIDFEENVASALSRPLAQAYDVVQMLASTLRLRQVPEAELAELARAALQAYLDGGPDPAVLARLRRVAALAARLDPLRPALSHVHRREMRAVLGTAEAMKLLLTA